MKVYLDIFTGDELSSDSYPMKLVDDVYYEFEGKVRQREREKGFLPVSSSRRRTSRNRTTSMKS